MEPSDEIVSTCRSAGCFALSMALRTSGMRVVAPVEVSLWTTHTALIACDLSSARRFSMASWSAPCRQSPGMNSTSSESFFAILCQSEAKWPVSTISTLSRGESVFTSAASHAPVPDAG
jgi:hypothetical protein